MEDITYPSSQVYSSPSKAGDPNSINFDPDALKASTTSIEPSIRIAKPEPPSDALQIGYCRVRLFANESKLSIHAENPKTRRCYGAELNNDEIKELSKHFFETSMEMADSLKTAMVDPNLTVEMTEDGVIILTIKTKMGGRDRFVPVEINLTTLSNALCIGDYRVELVDENRLSIETENPERGKFYTKTLNDFDIKARSKGWFNTIFDMFKYIKFADGIVNMIIKDAMIVFEIKNKKPLPSRALRIGDYRVELVVDENRLSIEAENSRIGKFYAQTLNNIDIQELSNGWFTTTFDMFENINFAADGTDPNVTIEITEDAVMILKIKTKIGKREIEEFYKILLEQDYSVSLYSLAFSIDI